jgi:hypothetical protein
VHVEAVGAAVNLGDPELDEVEKVLFDTRLGEILFQRKHGLVGPGGEFGVIEAGLHGDYSFKGSVDCEVGGSMAKMQEFFACVQKDEEGGDR